MNAEEIRKQYYIKFGVFPPIMMTKQGDSEKYLKAIKKAIDDDKMLTDEQIDKIFNEPYDLILKGDKKEAKKFNKFEKKTGENKNER